MFSIIIKDLNSKKTGLIREILYSDNMLNYDNFDSFLSPEKFIDYLLDKKEYYKDNFYSAFNKNKQYLIRIGDKTLSNFLYIYGKEHYENNKKIIYSDDNFSIYYKIKKYNKKLKLEDCEYKKREKINIFDDFKLIEPKKEKSYCENDD